MVLEAQGFRVSRHDRRNVHPVLPYRYLRLFLASSSFRQTRCRSVRYGVSYCYWKMQIFVSGFTAVLLPLALAVGLAQGL